MEYKKAASGLSGIKRTIAIFQQAKTTKSIKNFTQKNW